MMPEHHMLPKIHYCLQFKKRAEKLGYVVDVEPDDVVIANDDVLVLKTGLTIMFKKDLITKKEYLDWAIYTDNGCE